jgi:hypothetical protein
MVLRTTGDFGRCLLSSWSFRCDRNSIGSQAHDLPLRIYQLIYVFRPWPSAPEPDSPFSHHLQCHFRAGSALTVVVGIVDLSLSSLSSTPYPISSEQPVQSTLQHRLKALAD